MRLTRGARGEVAEVAEVAEVDRRPSAAHVLNQANACAVAASADIWPSALSQSTASSVPSAASVRAVRSSAKTGRWYTAPP